MNATKRVVINQSNYIPWKGYFDLIHDADLFIFYDDVQFTTRDWRNRNLIKGQAGPQWLTVPVGADRNRLIQDVTIDTDAWQAKHWRTLKHVYGKARCFEQYRPFLEHVYLERRWQRLSELNRFMTSTIARDFLGIATQFADSSQIPAAGHGQERILSLLAAVSATTYISGPAGQAYLDPEQFRERGIALVWKNYQGYPAYSQEFPPFEHAVSILDLLFRVGPDAPRYIWGWRDAAAEADRVRRA